MTAVQKKNLHPKLPLVQHNPFNFYTIIFALKGVPPLEDMTELLQQKSKASIVATSGSFKQAAAKTTTPVVSNIGKDAEERSICITFYFLGS